MNGSHPAGMTKERGWTKLNYYSNNDSHASNLHGSLRLTAYIL